VVVVEQLVERGILGRRRQLRRRWQLRKLVMRPELTPSR
jgi:hypothetical protein